MINREIIRIKIVQLTYAYYQNGNKNIDTAEKELFFSLSKAYDLYNYMLALIVAVNKEAARRNEVLVQRAKREGTAEPSQRFVFNRFAIQLAENKQLNDFMSTQKSGWDENAAFVSSLLEKIEQSEVYQEYMNNPEDNYDVDRELWRKIYRTLIQDNDELDTILEDMSLYWNDDKTIVDTFVLKTIKRFDEANADEYQRYMSEASRNWDFSRLAYMDIILMQIAIAEMMTLPNIPVSVSINEYVEIAKFYSTPKSAGYINGMLDSIARSLVDSGRLAKFIEPKKEKEHKEYKPKKQITKKHD